MLHGEKGWLSGLLLSAMASTTWAAETTQLPTFADYPTPAMPARTPLKLPKLHGHWLARRYPTVIRYSYQQDPHPNLAGRYLLSTAGCGTACQVVMITDVLTGRVQGLPDSANHTDHSFVSYANPMSWVEDPLGFDNTSRADSNLVVLRGCINGRPPAGFHTYLMKQGRLQYLGLVRPPMPADKPDDLPILDQAGWEVYLDEQCVG